MHGYFHEEATLCSQVSTTPGLGFSQNSSNPNGYPKAKAFPVGKDPDLCEMTLELSASHP